MSTFHSARGSAGLITSIIIAIIVIGGVVWVSSGSTPEEVMVQQEETAMMDKKSGYEAYAPEKLARAAEGDVVLFFHAPWCPTCRGVDSDITQNLSTIPESLTILKTDYDSETTLKQKYGVTYQHTFVQVDAAGNQIAKWSGSPTVADIIAHVK